MNNRTEERFLRDVETHQMQILRDEEVDRHIRYRRPNTITYGFDLITWSGNLLITGDCGSYLFRRVEDMFQFFRMGKTPADTPEDGQELFINPVYWSEKVLAADQNGKIQRWSKDIFKRKLRERVEEYYDTEEYKAEVWDQVKAEVFSHYDSPDILMRQALEFRYEGQAPFAHFYEVSCTEYTFNFLWCLYAIVWGIRTYDRVKKEEQTGGAEG